MIPPRTENGNRSAFFSELVGLEVWSSATGEAGIYNFHVDVAFKKARLGGDSGGNVTFDLTLKAADLLLVVPETEPLEILNDSTRRLGVTTEVTKRSLHKRTDDVQADISLGGSLGLEALSGELRANAGTSTRHTSEFETEILQRSGSITVQHFPGGDGINTWSFKSATVGSLQGKPWDALQEPRLSVRNIAKGKSARLKPCISCYIRCKKEDLQIHDIHIDDKPIGFISKMWGENHRKAAESYIRNKLTSIGLPEPTLSGRYSNVDLAIYVYDDWR